MTSIFNQFFNNNKNNREPGEIIYKNEKPKDMNFLKIKANIYGVVQGVGFRFTTVQLAKKLAINGIVRNENDGSVYVEATGDEENMENFISGLAKGPSPSARVEKMEVTFDSSVTNYNGFGERH